MAKRVKLYGSPAFQGWQNDLPAGVTSVEYEQSTEIWAGCLATCVPPDSTAYTHPLWRTSTSWSSGGYFRANLSSSAWGSGPAVIINDQIASGWETFTNWANNNKHVIMRAGLDLDDAVTVDYVRHWILCSNPDNSKNFFLQPVWYVVGDLSGESPASGIAGGKWGLDSSNNSLWKVDGAFTGRPSNSYYWTRSGSALDRQRSRKWTTSPIGGTFTGKQLKNIGWGVRHDARGGGFVFNVHCMGVEVGFDDAPTDYLVTTGPATPAVTSATLTGSVDPQGDAGGKWFFKWGLAPDDLDQISTEEDQPSSSLYNVILDITGLTTDVTYWYQLVARDSTGALHFGNILSFRTVTSCSVNPTAVA